MKAVVDLHVFCLTNSFMNFSLGVKQKLLLNHPVDIFSCVLPKDLCCVDVVIFNYMAIQGPASAKCSVCL